MQNYVALIDFEHLDHSVFLKSLAQSLSTHTSRKGILIHGDSEYTNRIMQSGMMREDARKRAVMDLNHRLIALFADHGVSTIGLHGYQKELIQKKNGILSLNRKVFDELPETPNLLLSSLITENGESKYIPPVELAEFLANELDDHELVIFSQDHSSDIFTTSDDDQDMKWDDLQPDFIEKHLSEEQQKIQVSTILTTALAFSGWPNPKKASKIR